MACAFSTLPPSSILPTLRVCHWGSFATQKGLESLDQLQEGGGRGVVDALQAVLEPLVRTSENRRSSNSRDKAQWKTTR